MDGKIIRLLPENYSKCSNIWDMEKNPARTRRWYGELLSGNRLTFVYVEKGEYVGEGSLVLQNGDPDYTVENRRIYLSRMIVKEEYRRRGVGGEMIDYLSRYAKELGYAELSLGVDIANVNARRLYEKKGFTELLFEGEDEHGKFVKLLKRL